MSYTGTGFGQEDALPGCEPRDCPGQEQWDASICACMCPAGTMPGSLIGDCLSPPKPTAPPSGPPPPATKTAKAGTGVSPFLALAIVGAAIVGGVAIYGKRKKTR